MDSAPNPLRKHFGQEVVSRRVFCGSLGALALTRRSFAESDISQASPPSQKRTRAHIPVTAINHMMINVSDLDRSLKWYQGLFGLPLVGRRGKTVTLRIGAGPQFLTIAGDSGGKPGIAHIGFATENFDADRILGTLNEHDVGPALKPGPLKAQVLPRGPGSGDASAGTPAVRFGDPAGIMVQVQDGLPVGGAGRSTPAPGLLSLRDYNHFTIFVPDAIRNVQFYQRLFGLRIDTYQGPMPIIRVGTGNQFLAFVGGRSSAFVHHACFTVDNFDPDRVLELLAEYGVKPRTGKRQAARPLQSYVTMRMPNRGGAPEGTPELYLTDPDGILLQIQDVRYSGGGGYLGNQRGTSESAK
jgi:catechol 2,3-dioxygenase-like lactoylglutathione lyase family enzyme